MMPGATLALSLTCHASMTRKSMRKQTCQGPRHGLEFMFVMLDRKVLRITSSLILDPSDLVAEGPISAPPTAQVPIHADRPSHVLAGGRGASWHAIRLAAKPGPQQGPGALKTPTAQGSAMQGNPACSASHAWEDTTHGPCTGYWTLGHHRMLDQGQGVRHRFAVGSWLTLRAFTLFSEIDGSPQVASTVKFLAHRWHANDSAPSHRTGVRSQSHRRFPSKPTDNIERC
jgi:hypothetical protein